MNGCIIIGGGGHALVCTDLAKECGYNIIGYTAPKASTALPASILYLGNDKEIEHFDNKTVNLINGIGFTPKEKTLRENIFQQYSNEYDFPKLIHPRAFVSKLSHIKPGAQIMAGVLIQAGTTIGENSIINTGVIIDHNCNIGRDCHIAPGSTLCGAITVEDSVFIGAGCVLSPNLTISTLTIINSGINLTHSIFESSYIKKKSNLIQKNLTK
jgi:UDP-perosamine 4-acetyltransferase